VVLPEKHVKEWMAPFITRGVDGPEIFGCTGFLDIIACTAAAFIRRGRFWVAATPLRTLIVRRVAGRAAALAACEHLGRIESLVVSDSRITSQDLSALAASPHLRKLKELNLQQNRITDEGARVFLSRRPPSLKVLHLGGNRISTATLVRLCQMKWT